MSLYGIVGSAFYMAGRISIQKKDRAYDHVTYNNNSFTRTNDPAPQSKADDILIGGGVL